MKLIIRYYDKVMQAVDNAERYKKTDEELQEIIDKANREKDETKYEYEMVEVPENLEHVFNYLLGEKQYKSTPKLRNIYERLRDLYDEIENVDTNLFELRDMVDDMKNDVKAVLKPEEIEED